MMTPFIVLSRCFRSVPPEIDESGLSQQLKDVFERAAASVGEERSDITVDISTQALWRAILATETESSPNIELNGASIKPSDTDSELILPYDADVDPLVLSQARMKSRLFSSIRMEQKKSSGRSSSRNQR
jgi:hypothetical protein